MTDALDLLTVGRVGVDLYGEELHAGFVESRRFQKSVGGARPTSRWRPPGSVAAPQFSRESETTGSVSTSGMRSSTTSA